MRRVASRGLLVQFVGFALEGGGVIGRRVGDLRDHRRARLGLLLDLREALRAAWIEPPGREEVVGATRERLRADPLRIGV